MALPPPAPAADRALTVLAEQVARAAGELLLDGVSLVRSAVTTKSTATDMVTEMDRASEELIVSKLLEARPDDGIVGEEGTDRAGTSGVRWIVDPLDGTTNYLYRHPGFAVSIAAEREGVVVAGAVVDPVHEQVFTATRGAGAWLDGTPIGPSAETDLGRSLVATGFGYDAGRRRRQAEVLVEVLPLVRDIRRVGAAAVDLCSVACGRVDAYFERGLALWDLAAGALIAAEAGAVVSDLAGEPAAPGFVMAAAPGVADALRSTLRSARADEA